MMSPLVFMENLGFVPPIGSVKVTLVRVCT